MGIEETALELTGLIYDAVLAPDMWQLFLVRLTQVLGTRSAMLREVDYATGSTGLYETVGIDPAYVKAYREHFVHLDIYAPALLSVPVGTIFTGDEVVPWEQHRSSAFYNDYMQGFGVHYVMGGALVRDGHKQLTFGVQREVGQGRFDDSDKKLLHLISPHIVRAIQIHSKMSEVTSLKNWALSALNRLRVGVILLNGQGHVVFLNSAAEQLAVKTDGFIIGRNGLTLSSASDTACLRGLISDATKLATGRGNAAGGYLRVHAVENERAAIQFQVIPLPQDISEQPLHGSCVAVFVSFASGPQPSKSRIASMHGLTSAEARLALLLAEGLSLKEASEALSVSVLTLRSQLKSVFVKTGVKRQTELVTLLLTDMLTNQLINEDSAF
jgi:DNA-binding CsgD family transcriptional regulator/PAS domain-containing protein